MSLTIALINGKGGVGKTTVSLLLALALRQVCRDVVLLDRDPQKSATTFAENMGLPVVDVPPADGPLVIIDTPPNIHHPDTLSAIARFKGVGRPKGGRPKAVGASLMGGTLWRPRGRSVDSKPHCRLFRCSHSAGLAFGPHRQLLHHGRLILPEAVSLTRDFVRVRKIHGTEEGIKRQGHRSGSPVRGMWRA